MPRGDAAVKVGGVDLRQIAPAGGLSWSHSADAGCKDAKWTMDLSRRFLSPALEVGNLVELKAGTEPLWRGLLTEKVPGDDGWEFTALGLYAEGSDYQAFDASGNATTVPNVAIDQAIARGCRWVRRQDFSSAPFVTDDLTDGLPKVGELLDAWADAQGVRWGVNARGEVYWAADPVTPRWRVLVDDAVFGVADDEYASHVFVRYAATGGLATESAGNNDVRPKEFPVDITTRGVLTAAQAKAHAEGLLEKGKKRLGWLNGIEPSASQIATIGGTQNVDLRLIRGQQMVRLFGITDLDRGPQAYVDWVIGETEYEAGSSSISLTPLGLAERTLGDVLGGAA